MGNFFHAAHLRTTDSIAARAALEAAAQALKFRCWVAPFDGTWLTFFPNSAASVSAIARHIERMLPCDLLVTVVHDSDVFCYTLYRGGEEADEFASDPEYFSDAPEAARLAAQGDPVKVTPLLAPGHTSADLAAWFEQRTALDPETLMGQFMAMLAIRHGLSSYDYLERGEDDGAGRRREFVHVPNLAAEKASAKIASERIRLEKQKLVRDGTLIFDSTLNRGRNAWANMQILGPHPAGGFLCAWYRDDLRVQHWLPPALPVPLDCGDIKARWGDRHMPLPGRLLADTAAGPVLFDLTHGSSTPCPGCVHGALVALDDTSGTAFFMGREDLVATKIHDAEARFRIHIGHSQGKFLRHPRLPHLLWHGPRELGVVDIQSGREINRCELFNRLIVPKKIAQWRAQGIEPEAWFELDREDFRSLAFSPDGKSVLAGTSEGLRIYDYADILNAGPRVPDPEFSFETSIALQDYRSVTAVLIDPHHQVGIFTRGDDSLLAIDLSTRRVTEIQPSLDQAQLCSLVCSRDHLAGLRCGYMNIPRREDEISHQIWSSTALLAKLSST